ncbi:OLC1v1035480C1 [Oldenlandia corymbosa var. corymbosa]|uniref:OLC1v1035480C1 n=1 Tax=Oldenlandia corymbosa var. corymbosa TaxID=529605 RepID=A0AAV1CT30_OLDCO|nr:OLC1v1035480C1 [Oldenlandia corymbosa var. corymbosa]
MAYFTNYFILFLLLAAFVGALDIESSGVEDTTHDQADKTVVSGERKMSGSTRKMYTSAEVLKTLPVKMVLPASSADGCDGETCFFGKCYYEFGCKCDWPTCVMP